MSSSYTDGARFSWSDANFCAEDTTNQHVFIRVVHASKLLADLRVPVYNRALATTSIEHETGQEKSLVQFTYHSEVIAKIDLEKLCRRLEQASGLKVPPEWLTMITIGSSCIAES